MEPTWPVYAGYLCATHLNERVQVNGQRGLLLAIRYESKRETVGIRIRDYETGHHVHLSLDPRDVVYSDG
jgi:hypothetical protein